jgi:hypothetical protein
VPWGAVLAEASHRDSGGVKVPESQQVSWWEVHTLVAAVLNQVNDWPMLGTPAWCSLAHEDPRKWAALLDGAQHHALRLELNQEARAEGSRAVSAAVDWPALGREIRIRAEFYAARPWLRRVVS